MGAKIKEEILKQSLVTKTDLRYLFKIGPKSANTLFEAVKEEIENEGKLIIPGKIPIDRIYKRLGMKKCV